MRYGKLLTDVGLNDAEAKAYDALLELGQSSVNRIMQKAGLKRPTAYHALEQLTKKGLVESVTGLKKKEFRALSPENLDLIFGERETELGKTKKSVELFMPELVSQYILSSKRPNVSYHEGLKGIKRLYQDILSEKKGICLIRSPFDEDFPELARLVKNQIQKQVENKIHTRAITPLVNDTKEAFLKYDKGNLVERRIVPKERFLTPAQIIIYGDKVAITSFHKPLITTIINNKDIKNTFMTIFEYIWEVSNGEHQKIVSGFKD